MTVIVLSGRGIFVGHVYRIIDNILAAYLVVISVIIPSVLFHSRRRHH